MRYASCVANFLAIWRSFIMATRGLTLKANFITREGFIDAIISFHLAVLLMCELHDNFPHLPLELSLTGSQCLH